jgi:hypothetical protein
VVDASPVSVSQNAAQGVLDKVLEATPSWVLAFCGGSLTITICLIAILNLGGFTSPIQRIMVAQAVRIEKSVDSLGVVAEKLERVTADIAVIQDINKVQDNRLAIVEKRVDKIDDYHYRAKVTP